MKHIRAGKMLLLSTCTVMMIMSEGTQAQSIDYSVMEELFGEPVTTSANGSPQRVSEVALSMDILTAEDIERTGAKSIPEALRFLPGINVRQYSQGQHEVGIRGYNQGSAERILVLVNGRQVYTDFFGQVVWENIPVEISEIKQIEVVKGPNTALFGFNAVSGVVNIITYNPLYDEARSVSLSAGTASYQALSGVLTHKITDKFAFKVSGGTNKIADDFDDVENRRNINPLLDYTERESVALDVWGQVTEHVQAQLELTKNDHARNEFLVTRGLTSTEYDTTSARTRILADTSIGLIEADLYHNETRADYDLFFTSGASKLQADNRVTVAKLNDTFELGSNHIIRMAGEYRSASNIFSSPTATLDQSDLTYDIWSGSALWDWIVTDRLRTSVALRYDNFHIEPDGQFFVAPGVIGTLNPSSDSDYDQRREEIGYNVGATYKVDNKNTLKFSTARGADLPSFTEMGLQFFASAGTSPASGTYGNPNTDTSIVTNYEIGYDRQIDDINGVFRSAIFYQYNDEMQAFGGDIYSAGGVDFSIIQNIGDSEMYGIELGLEGLYLGKWGWDINYAYIEINDNLRNTQNSAQRSSSTSYEDAQPNHIVNAHLGYSEEKWRTDIFAQYRNKSDDIVDASTSTNNEFNLEEVNDQFIVNANFAYDITDHLTWSVSGTSIIGKTQQSVETDAERVVWSTLKYNF